MNLNDSYQKREKVDINRSFFWEKLPILKHLVTKRALAKTKDIHSLLLLDYFNLEIKIDDNGEMSLVKKGKK